MKIDLSEILGIAVAKVLQYKGISLSPEEVRDFWEKLKNDSEFIEAYKRCVKNEI